MNSIQLSLWQVLLSFVALHGYFLSVVLFVNKKGSKTANHILSALVFCISVLLTDYIFSNIGLSRCWPHLILAAFPLWFFIGPLFYFYFMTALNTDRKWQQRDLLHFSLVALAALNLLRFYLLDAPTKLTVVFERSTSDYEILPDMLMTALFSLQAVYYIFKVLAALKNYEQKYMGQVSNTIIQRIDWLKLLLRMFIIFLISDLAISNLLAFWGQYSAIYVFAAYFLIAIFVYVIAYTMVLTPEKLFTQLDALTTKYRTSMLSQVDLVQIKKQLLDFMLAQKPFLDESLRLTDLAKNLNLPMHHLSQVLNQELNLNFYDFINRYRVQEAQARLIDPKYSDLTFLAIAFDVGFNSNASFYRIFKKHTGQTPSQYIAKQGRVAA